MMDETSSSVYGIYGIPLCLFDSLLCLKQVGLPVLKSERRPLKPWDEFVGDIYAHCTMNRWPWRQ